MLKPPDWSKSQVNRWADFIELQCLCDKDHLMSKDDVFDIFNDSGLEDLSKGEADHSAKYDKLITFIGNYYEIIDYRQSTHTEYYPFNVEDGQCISLKSELTEKHTHYIFLLLCSSIYFLDNTTMQKITHAFEKYCHPIMKILVPVDAQTELFGTTREASLFKGNLRKRIEQLAECLGTTTTKSMDRDDYYDRVNAGDDGLDIVSFLKLDNASHIPFALAQCTCSYDEWVNKQKSIDSASWRARFDSLAPFWEFMYVPFFYRNASGRFEQSTKVYTCLIDRERILNILELHNELFHELEFLNIENLIEEIM